MSCWAKPLFNTPCRYPMQRAHLGTPKRDLKREMRKRGENWDIWDPRAWVYCCWGHHQLIDGPNFHLWKHQLPPSVIEFHRELGIEHLLDNSDRRHRETMEWRKAA